MVALADIFGVTTDYLLRLQLEQTKPEEKQPAAPGTEGLGGAFFGL